MAGIVSLTHFAAESIGVGIDPGVVDFGVIGGSLEKVQTVHNSVCGSHWLFAFVSWLLMLAAVSLWALRITGRIEVTRLVFVSVSLACIETPWWFSASTYLLAKACVFAVLAVIAGPRQGDAKRFAGIAACTALGMSFSALGLMAVVLGGLATLGRFGLKNATIVDLAALARGFLAYRSFAQILGGEIVSTETTRFSLQGFAYALAVPGGVAAPLLLGLDAHAVTGWFSFVGGIAITILLAVLLMRSRGSFSLRFDLAMMAIVPYLAIYPARAALVVSGAWTQPDFLYLWTSRYHLFMTVVLAVGVAVVFTKFLDLATFHGFRIARVPNVLVMLGYALLQGHNAGLMRHVENQPAQAPTLAALMRLEHVATADGIPIDQIQRVIPAVRRGWNASVLELRPDRFHHVMLIARRGSSASMSQSRMSDAEATRLLIERLGLQDWRTLNAHRLTNLAPNVIPNGVKPVTKEPVDFAFGRSRQVSTYAWEIVEPFGHVEFSLAGLSPSSIVIFQDIHAAGTVHIEWTTEETFDGQRIAEYEPEPARHRPVPERIVFRPADFVTDRAMEPTGFTVRFRIRSTRQGKLSIRRILVGEDSTKTP
ncbi:hypothetical protein GC170_21330 [bacterium]|nr:hypothetical protein [bacterium]